MWTCLNSSEGGVTTLSTSHSFLTSSGAKAMTAAASWASPWPVGQSGLSFGAMLHQSTSVT